MDNYSNSIESSARCLEIWDVLSDGAAFMAEMFYDKRGSEKLVVLEDKWILEGLLGNLRVPQNTESNSSERFHCDFISIV